MSVRHPFRIREIAAQAGLSEATVDRALHGRPGVRASTVREVRQAIADLDRQQSQVRLAGRSYLIDVVVQAPERFSGAVRGAVEHELPLMEPVHMRARFHFQEVADEDDVVRTLERIARKGSDGVVLKSPDSPAVVEAVERLEAADVPVVTLVTDLPTSRRRRYVGIDNRAAGQTAAYLVEQWLRVPEQEVLVTLSSSLFRGEEEREMGFRAGMRRLNPDRVLVEIAGADGLDAAMREVVRETLERHPRVTAVYSIGGGNTAVVAALDEVGRRCDVFVAHDLDADNRRLLAEGRLSAVLHHDLRRDMRTACLEIMRAHDAERASAAADLSPIQVVTPFNVPVP